jgi:hypothetical protein
VRWNFLEAIITRSRNAHPDIRADMLLSVQSALGSSLKIRPDLCERYIRLWRQDLADWKRRAAAILQMPSINAALREMWLLPPTQRGRTVKFGTAEMRRQTVTAGPVMIRASRP